MKLSKEKLVTFSYQDVQYLLNIIKFDQICYLHTLLKVSEIQTKHIKMRFHFGVYLDTNLSNVKFFREI